MTLIYQSYDSSQLLLNEQLLQSLIIFDQENFKWPWTEINWRDFLRTRLDSKIFILVGESNTIYGFNLVELVDNSAYLHKICIDPKLEGKGHGSELINRGLIALRSAKISTLSLEVDTNNQRAIEFYKARGFVQIGKRKRFYSDGSDAFVFELSVTAPV